MWPDDHLSSVQTPLLLWLSNHCKSSHMHKAFRKEREKCFSFCGPPAMSRTLKWTANLFRRISKSVVYGQEVETGSKQSSKQSSSNPNGPNGLSEAESLSLETEEESEALEMREITRQSSPRHHADADASHPGLADLSPSAAGGSPSKAGVSPSKAGVSPSTARGFGEDKSHDAADELAESWRCGLPDLSKYCKFMEEDVSQTMRHMKIMGSEQVRLTSIGVQTEPAQPAPQEKPRVLEEVDFSKLVQLAEERRHQFVEPLPQKVRQIGKTSKMSTSKNEAKTRKVFVMPSPDEYYFALDKARRQQVSEVQVASPTSAMSPTSCTNDTDQLFLHPIKFYTARAKADESSKIVLWSLTRTWQIKFQIIRFTPRHSLVPNSA